MNHPARSGSEGLAVRGRLQRVGRAGSKRSALVLIDNRMILCEDLGPGAMAWWFMYGARKIVTEEKP